METHKLKPDQNLEARAALFKALGHPARLLMLNLISAKPRHGEELATILSLSPATVSHHLSKLADAGMLQSAKDQYYQIYSLAGGMLNKTLGELIAVSQASIAVRVEPDAYRQKVLDTFFRRGRLVKIPAQLKKQQIVLERLVEAFEPDRDYAEREVNRVLVDFNDDVATLRRGLVEHRLMQRESGMYRRIPG